MQTIIFTYRGDGELKHFEVNIWESEIEHVSRELKKQYKKYELLSAYPKDSCCKTRPIESHK